VAIRSDPLSGTDRYVTVERSKLLRRPHLPKPELLLRMAPACDVPPSAAAGRRSLITS
jgi:hypothetical protein